MCQVFLDNELKDYDHEQQRGIAEHQHLPVYEVEGFLPSFRGKPIFLVGQIDERIRNTVHEKYRYGKAEDKEREYAAVYPEEGAFRLPAVGRTGSIEMRGYYSWQLRIII